jgi:hypothetical protein
MVMPGSSDFVNPSPDTPKELATSAGFTNETSFLLELENRDETQMGQHQRAGNSC